MYTIKEAHEKLNCNRQTVNNWIKRLDIEVVTIDGMYRLTEEQYNMIADKVNANRNTNADTNHANTHNDNANVEDKEENTTSIDYETIVEQYEARIRDLKESHANHIKDLNKQLDEKQQAIEYLTVSVATNRLNSEENSSEDTRSIVSSGSNQSDNKDVEDAEVKEDVTNTNIEDTESNIDNVKEDKPKGFFAKLFNL
ncbi:helix-turn-helix domain-containing protein [Staphylococcus xylosus]|uniref:helix-turn-helix domain-containing protein n=1 Tax=Staphylococcus xylosus TaxID=1288 RepID=UPI003F5693EE